MFLAYGPRPLGRVSRSELSMDFSISEDSRLLMDSVVRFVREELQPLEDDVEATGVLAPEIAQEIFRKSKALGFYAMNMP